MRLVKINVIMGGLAVLLIWPDPSAADEIEKGRALAERLCANCHLNEGQGEKQGSTGIPGFRAVARRPGQTVDNILKWLRSVPPMMPNHHLSQDEMLALALFIESLREER
jgi:mono/diheme cytochrome c family protein